MGRDPGNEEEADQLRRYAERWRRVGPLLDRQREEDVRQCGDDAAGAFRFFAGMVLPAVKASATEDVSGLVEQQRWFRKIAQA